ncbi:PadR family transcriptional regulator [Plantibacter flavus]|uniref:PadR family transcriptional regulator n=1 Tax=Plantibacter flavus TaxID=150123 RepID=UPI003F170602
MARRRPGTLFPLELDILDVGTVLQSTEGSFYGFALAKQLADADGALTAHGTLYKALSRMTAAGLVEATWEDPAVAEGEGRPRRRLYRITGEGASARDREHARLLAERRSAARATGAAWSAVTSREAIA